MNIALVKLNWLLGKRILKAGSRVIYIWVEKNLTNFWRCDIMITENIEGGAADG